MGMIKKYFTELSNYKKQYGEKIILLWQCGGFYEVYGLKDTKTGEIIESNIESFGSICDYAVKEKKTASRVGKKSQKYVMDGKSRTVMMSGVPIFGNVENKICKLTENGFTVALWKQDEKIKDIREEFGIYSPGTKFVEGNQLSNNIMCLYLEAFEKTFLCKNPRIICGLSVVDIISGDTKYFEYNTSYLNESINYDEIERFNSIYNPMEIIIIHNFENMEKMKNLLQFSAINCESKHIFKIGDEECVFKEEINNCKKQTYQLETLKKFHTIDSDFFFASFANYEYGTASFCFLLNFIYRHQKNLVLKLKTPVYDNNENTLLLANHSLKQLNIITTNNNLNKKGSVLRFLNNCKTPMGKREFNYQLLHPITNEENLNMEYDIVEYLIKSDTFESLELNKIGDLDKFYRKIILDLVTPCNIYKFYDNLRVINKISEAILSDKVLNKYFMEKIGDIKVGKYCKKICKELNSKIYLSKLLEINSRNVDTNIFKKGIYKEVDNAVSNFERANIEMNTLYEFFNSTLKKTEKRNKGGVKLIEKETMFPYLNATSRRVEILKSHFAKMGDTVKLEYKYLGKKEILNFDIKSIKYLDSTKNNKKFISEQLNQLYRRVFEGKSEIKRCVNEAYIDFAKGILKWSREMELISNFVKILDVIMCKSSIAVKYNYCKPQIVENEKSFYKCEKIRHLLIEHLQTNELYTPNDIGLGKQKDGILLYGTNAVGKSSLIKAIGICIIMAQSGMYVPCSSFIYKPYKSLYTRILGNDDIFKGLSSFAVEMSELKTILNSDKNSLILGDELCRGTEFNSALRIFVAGLMKLGEIGCSHIFATHFHEITEMKEIRNLSRLSMKHLSVSYNKELGELIYDRKLKNGPGTNNYGLMVCKSLGLQDDFISYAENLELNIKLKSDNILSNKTSNYNSSFVKGKCELCGNDGVDVHHKYPQKMANGEGNIETNDFVFNKNHKANLMNLCKECHKKVTKDGTIYVKKKSMSGYRTVVL